VFDRPIFFHDPSLYISLVMSLLCWCQIVYILDQVRALENEMVLRLKKQGLDVTPKILIVSSSLASVDGIFSLYMLSCFDQLFHSIFLALLVYWYSFP
jgi:hypothetical protein